MSRKSWAILAAALLCAFPALGQQVPDGPGKELAEANCNICHTLVSRVGAGYTPEGWNTVLRMMINQGAPLPADQIEPLKAYLIKSFPEKGKPAGVVIPHLVQRVRRDPEYRGALRSQIRKIPELGDPRRRQHRAQHVRDARRQFFAGQQPRQRHHAGHDRKVSAERILAARTQIGVRAARRTIP